MKPVIRKPYNSMEFKKNYEENNLPSLTIPDQALSAKDMLDRFAKGLPISGGKIPLYEEDIDNPMPDLTNMDISEIHEMKEEVRKYIKDEQAKIIKSKDQEKYKKFKEMEAQLNKTVKNLEEYKKRADEIEKAKSEGNQEA